MLLHVNPVDVQLAYECPLCTLLLSCALIKPEKLCVVLLWMSRYLCLQEDIRWALENEVRESRHGPTLLNNEIYIFYRVQFQLYNHIASFTDLPFLLIKISESHRRKFCFDNFIVVSRCTSNGLPFKTTDEV